MESHQVILLLFIPCLVLEYCNYSHFLAQTHKNVLAVWAACMYVREFIWMAKMFTLYIHGMYIFILDVLEVVLYIYLSLKDVIVYTLPRLEC